MNVKRMMMKECGCNSNFFLLSFNVRSGNYSQLSRPINKSSSFKMPNMAVRIDPIKLICSLHVTQLDEKLDLEKMVGPILRMSCRNMTENGCGKWREDSKEEDSHSTQNFHPIFLIFKSSLHDTQLDENLIWNGTITIQQSSN